MTRAYQPVESAARTQAIRQASTDLGPNYRDGCHARLEQIDQPDCAYGALGSARKVVLFGDSHAAQWMEALDKAATQAGWELRSWTKTSCPSADVTVWYPPKKTIYNECTRWRDSTIKRINDLNPSIVILVATADYSGWLTSHGHVIHGGDAIAALQDGMLATVDKLSTNGRQIVVIRDNPTMYRGFRDCLAAGHDNCGRSRSEALGQSLTLVSHVALHRLAVKSLDLTDRVCTRSWCPAVRNDQILFLDRHHFTTTFARSLWPDFSAILQQAQSSTLTSEEK